MSQHAERAQRVALAQPPAQPQHLDRDDAVTMAVAQQAGSDPASFWINLTSQKLESWGYPLVKTSF